MYRHSVCLYLVLSAESGDEQERLWWVLFGKARRFDVNDARILHSLWQDM